MSSAGAGSRCVVGVQWRAAELDCPSERALTGAVVRALLQRTLVEAWTIVGRAFVDPSFNNHNWEEELREHMLSAYNATNSDLAASEIQRMLEDLGDPYTRRVPPE
jgi:hypothetical protein